MCLFLPFCPAFSYWQTWKVSRPGDPLACWQLQVPAKYDCDNCLSDMKRGSCGAAALWGQRIANIGTYVAGGHDVGTSKPPIIGGVILRLQMIAACLCDNRGVHAHPWPGSRRRTEMPNTTRWAYARPPLTDGWPCLINEDVVVFAVCQGGIDIFQLRHCDDRPYTINFQDALLCDSLRGARKKLRMHTAPCCHYAQRTSRPQLTISQQQAQIGDSVSEAWKLLLFD